MALFFGLMTKEIVEATAPNGVLHTRRLVLFPVVAAIGATVVPALLYGPASSISLEEPMLVIGWPVTLAVDLAVIYVVARIIFGAHPVVPFLLLLGIAADGFGFVTLALLNPAGDIHLVAGALILSVAIGLAIVLRQLGVRSFWPVRFGAGTVSWLALFWGGMHPALALLPIMPFLPHAARDPGFFADALPGAKDTLSRFDVWARHPAQVTLFFFGLVNAGVPVGALEEGTWGLPLAVLAGRPIGLVIGVGLGLLAGLHLPPRVGWRELIVGGFIAAMRIQRRPVLLQRAGASGAAAPKLSMGVLLCLAAAPLAIVLAKVSRAAGSRRRSERSGDAAPLLRVPISRPARRRRPRAGRS